MEDSSRGFTVVISYGIPVKEKRKTKNISHIIRTAYRKLNTGLLLYEE
jgi:hypothetical protein